MVATGKKRKRVLVRDVQEELEAVRDELDESKRNLCSVAKENARLRVLLKKYMEMDNSLLSASQLSQSSEKNTSDAIDDGTEDDELQNLSQITDIATYSQLEEAMSFLERQNEPNQVRKPSASEELDFLDDQAFAQFSPVPPQKPTVRVGVGVLLTCSTHPNAVLMGERHGSHGENKLALPGGHLEFGETWEECAIREVKEETDVTLQDATYAYVTNDYMESEDKHYITIFMKANVEDPSVVRNLEPEKCKGWKWYPWDSLSQSEYHERLFLPLKHLVSSSYQFETRSKRSRGKAVI